MDYWYNWPVSMWSARLRWSFSSGWYAQAGAYEVNPRNLDDRFFNFHSHGATGVLTSVELGLNGMSAGAGRVTSIRVGGWYSSANGNDVLLDRNRKPRLLTGLDPLSRESRYGIWLVAQHQLTGHAQNGKSVDGLSVFLNVTQTDRTTAVTDNQIALGIFYKGLLPQLQGDVLGLGIARTNVNSRAARGGLLPPGPRGLDAEYAAELYYSLHPFGWLDLRPNLQFVNQPGGRRDAPNVAVLGVKAAIAL